MSDMIDAPKFTVRIRTDAADIDAPMLGFVRWKLMPIEKLAVGEPEEDPGQTEPSTVKT